MIKEQVNPFEAAIATAIESREHTVVIRTQYGETTRECYCIATTAEAGHHENEFPWIGFGGENLSS